MKYNAQNVTFIIPSHNNAGLLQKTLASLASQHCLLNWEIIVVDNNSTDESISQLHRNFRDRFNITLIQQPKLKHPFALCNARNKGLKIAQGEWIVVMDADTIPNSNYLLSLEKFINRYSDKALIATCERIFISAEEISHKDIEAAPNLLSQLPPISSPSNYGLLIDRRMPFMKKLPSIEHPWDYMHGCNVIFKKQDALKIGGYDESYDGHWGFEDIDFAYRMIKHQGCEPMYAEGLQVFHQDKTKDSGNVNRLNKVDNPNWTRICNLIPGYEQYKIKKYRILSADIKI